MERSHSDAVYEILSHVPACSVLNCKLVCKTWKSMLSHRKVGLIFMISLHGGTDAQLCYGDYDELHDNDHGRFSHETLTKINLPPIKMVKEEPIIVGSCNGLVCISLPEHDDYFLYDPVYICNPTTGEYVNLPKLSMEYGQIASGFGYLPKTNEYKVVRVYYTVEMLSAKPYIPCGKVQVYTLGSGGGWRNIKDIPFEFSMPGAAGNGVIYFMDDVKRILVTFDLADEEFRVLQQPPCFHLKTCNSYEAKVLGGCLYVVHRVRGKSFELWSFEDNQKKINIEDNNKEKDTDHSGSWKKEFSIPWQGRDCSNSHDAISLTKSNQLLFWFCSRVLCCYDRKEGTVTEIASIDPDIVRSLQAIPHMSSHVSLKDLGIQSDQV